MLFLASRMDQIFLLILWLIGQFRIRVGMKIDGPNYDTPLMQKNMYTIWVVFALSFEGHTYIRKKAYKIWAKHPHTHIQQSKVMFVWFIYDSLDKKGNISIFMDTRLDNKLTTRKKRPKNCWKNQEEARSPVNCP